MQLKLNVSKREVKEQWEEEEGGGRSKLVEFYRTFVYKLCLIYVLKCVSSGTLHMIWGTVSLLPCFSSNNKQAIFWCTVSTLELLGNKPYTAFGGLRATIIFSLVCIAFYCRVTTWFLCELFTYFIKLEFNHELLFVPMQCFVAWCNIRMGIKCFIIEAAATSEEWKFSY